MRRFTFYLLLLTLAVVVVGISVAVLRSLHWSVLAYVVVVPIWITVLTVLLLVARVTFKRNH